MLMQPPISQKPFRPSPNFKGFKKEEPTRKVGPVPGKYKGPIKVTSNKKSPVGQSTTITKKKSY